MGSPHCVASICFTINVCSSFTSVRLVRYCSMNKRKSEMFTCWPCICSSVSSLLESSESLRASSTSLTLLKSTYSRRLTRRPAPFCILRQFWNEPLTNANGGTVTVVLSKFRTFTVVRLMSSTTPSAGVDGTVIQSPFLTMSLLVSLMPATNPSMVSLNTSINMAEVAPRPAMSDSGFLLKRIATTTITAIKITITFNTPQNVRIYWRTAGLEDSLSCVSELMKAMKSLTDITTMYMAVSFSKAVCTQAYWKNTKGKSHETTMAGTIRLAVFSTLSLRRMSSQLLFVLLVMRCTTGISILRQSAPAAQASNMVTSTNKTWRTMGTALPDTPVRRMICST